jgi:hypothetical protein
MSTTPGICLEGLMKTMINLSHDSQPPGRDLNPGPSDYEAGVLSIPPRRSVCRTKERHVKYVRN